MDLLTLLFLVCLLGDVFIRYWLARRQIRYVLAHRNEVPAPFAGRIGLHSHQRAADYTVTRSQLSVIERIIEAAVLLALTLLGGLQAINLELGRLIESELWRQMALVGVVLALLGGVGLAFSAWKTFHLEARFGFNRMTPRLFVIDALKMLAVTLVLGVPLLAAILWVMGSTGRDWAWWAWGVWVVFNLLILWLYPSFIAPLFNRFTPLDDPELSERIHGLAQRCHFGLSGPPDEMGFPGNRVVIAPMPPLRAPLPQFVNAPWSSSAPPAAPRRPRPLRRPGSGRESLPGSSPTTGVIRNPVVVSSVGWVPRTCTNPWPTPISSWVSRNAAATTSASKGSMPPPGKLTCPA
ncbi:hypothetical protein CDEF62S_02492 [Castellaniella defragrans]